MVLDGQTFEGALPWIRLYSKSRACPEIRKSQIYRHLSRHARPDSHDRPEVPSNGDRQREQIRGEQCETDAGSRQVAELT